MFWNKTRKIQLIELFYESKKGLYEEIKKKIKSRKYFIEYLKEKFKFSEFIYLNDLKSFHFYLFVLNNKIVKIPIFIILIFQENIFPLLPNNYKIDEYN